MKLRSIAPALALSAAAVAPLVAPRAAHACGGCYHRPSETESTVVTGHRMVLSVSMTQTVLWDQIEYDGDPSEFAWVLPVKKGARVEVATDAFFETLDAATTVSVVSPPLDCAPAPSATRGGGCSSSDSEFLASRDESGGFGSDVDVLHRGTVGPYQTVTLSTDTPGALNLWLTEHDYAVDAEIQPIIDAYVAEGFDFIALRLLPDKDVNAMKPVRVVTPGASPTLPLRMVAAGTGANVGIKLFVITEGRFATKNFPNGAVPAGDLTWDHLKSESNYAPLREAAISANEGRTWLTAFAKPGALLSPVSNPTSGENVMYATSEGLVDTIAEAYVHQAVKNGETQSDLCLLALAQHANSALIVEDPCPPDTPDPSQCPAPAAATIDARAFVCGEADDLAVALNGLHPKDVWVTRLEAFLPRAALATDLELEPAAAQTTVENWLKPAKIENEKEACRQALDSSAGPVILGDKGGKPSRWAAFGGMTAALALLAAARRLAKLRGSSPVSG